MRSEEHLSRIIAYYDATRDDYEKAWFDPSNFAVHFGFYDDRARQHAQALNNTNRIMAETAGITSSDTVLDAGCGRGGSCFWLVRNYGLQVTGISPVAGQIADCRKTAGQMGISDQANFLQADYTNTPFAAQSFDVVWACESVCHALKKSDFYREAYRLLRPGGRLVVAEYMRTVRPLSPKGEEQLKRWLEKWAIPDLDSVSEHQQHLIHAGFDRIQFNNVTPNVSVSLRNLSRKSTQWRAYSWLLTLLQLRNPIQHGNLLGGIYQYTALQSGCWSYQLLSAQKPG